MANWKLLEPVTVGKLLFRNRIVMPPMLTCSARLDGSVTKVTLDHYSTRARGGVGAIIVEYSFVDNKASKAAPSQLGIYSDNLLAGLNQLAEVIKANGAAALIQIVHGGRQSSPGAMGREPVAPSAIPSKVTGVMPKELTIAEIVEIEDAFAEAALRAKLAGFDGVELHGAHGYLLSEFLSPYTNHRTDKYGGGLEGRATAALEIIAKIRRKVGSDFIVGYRMSADDYLPGGITIAETGQFAMMLENAGVDYIHVSAGMAESGHHTVQPMYVSKAHNVHLAEGIKKMASIPVITVGSHDVYTAEEALKQGKADLVAMGRTLLADPELPTKLASGRVSDIRPCIRGNEGCISRVDFGLMIRCEVNPACCRDDEFNIIPAANKKRVTVIGGGIAGLEAARVAALRGHEVTLLEKGGKLGGHLIEATVPKFKDKTRELLGWLIEQVEKTGVRVKLKTEATSSLIGELKPQVLIVAIGSDYIIPRVPGCEKACVLTAKNVLLGERAVGDKVVVVGAGLIGCETALYLTDELNRKVSIVEMLDEMLVGVQFMCQLALKERLKELDVDIHLGWHLDEITDKGLICSDKIWRRHQLEADTVVLATGLAARKGEVEQFKGLAPEVYTIGDCVEARKIYHCFEDAWRVALRV